MGSIPRGRRLDPDVRQTSVVRYPTSVVRYLMSDAATPSEVPSAVVPGDPRLQAHALSRFATGRSTPPNRRMRGVTGGACCPNSDTCCPQKGLVETDQSPQGSRHSRRPGRLRS
jgi:hypothetical protein